MTRAEWELPIASSRAISLVMLFCVLIVVIFIQAVRIKTLEKSLKMSTVNERVCSDVLDKYQHPKPLSSYGEEGLGKI